MPERTKSGKWKWGNVERNSRKELAQTVYGIWKGTGSKGSFHNFYHYGNGYRTAKKNKLRKEGYQLNPLLESSFFDKSLFFTKEVTSDDIKDICIRIKNNLDNPKINESRKEIMRKMYWELRLLRVKMRRNAVQKVPYKIVQSIIGK